MSFTGKPILISPNYRLSNKKPETLFEPPPPLENKPKFKKIRILNERKKKVLSFFEFL